MKKIIFIIIIVIALIHGYNTKKPIPVYIYETNYTETITQIDELIINQEKALEMTKTTLSSNKSLNKNETINNYK